MPFHLSSLTYILSAITKIHLQKVVQSTFFACRTVHLHLTVKHCNVKQTFLFQNTHTVLRIRHRAPTKKGCFKGKTTPYQTNLPPSLLASQPGFQKQIPEIFSFILHEKIFYYKCPTFPLMFISETYCNGQCINFKQHLLSQVVLLTEQSNEEDFTMIVQRKKE